jgi:uncharacterized protein (UPF0210 family)
VEVKDLVRHSASVQLKNIIEHHWKFTDALKAKEVCEEGFDFIVISEEDKHQVRENIIQSIAMIQVKNIS